MNTTIDNFHGIVPPMITPMLPDETVDEDGVKKLTEYLIGSGVDGLFLLGSSGEFPSVPLREKVKFVKQVAEINAGRVPIVVGSSEPSTRRTLDTITALEEAEIDGVVVSPPFYYPLDQKGVIEHYEYLADACDLPIILYDIPLTTGVPVESETIKYLVDEGAVNMIKDSSGDFIEFQHRLEILNDGSQCVMFQGHEKLAWASLLAGADGLIPASANLFPKLYTDLVDNVREGNGEASLHLQQKIRDWLDVYSYGSVYGAIKTGLNYLNICSDNLSKPLQLPTPKQKEAIKSKIRKLQEEDYCG